uniref:SH3b domain-containing protein n=1 Tax=uncultured bacterium contig00003 TaxID=1181495 RepID=A0A806KBJ3_9BACT|nr:hypothetical protein [uncultured bacterium contig00003]
MKKLITVFILCLFATGFTAAQVSRGGTLYVATKTVALKSGTGFFASTRATLNYGDRVTVLAVSGKFVEVRSAANSSLSGWTASANLSAKQIVSGNTNTATAREVALAGKGFNQEVENSYKRQGNLNYADVDRIEALTVTEADLKRFLEQGRLAMGD